jgi:sphingomyelin phosphodiesterase acid-like 3
MRQMTRWAILAVAVASGTLAHAASRFLWISDIHFNPMADAALVPELQNSDPAQWESILNRTSPNTFSQYKSDTNWWLLKSALEQFPRTIRHPAFVMVTGDLLAHNFPDTFQDATHDSDPQHYRQFVLKTVQFLALKLQQEFPATKIFLTPGNNDNDCGDYTIEANGDFLNNTAQVARELARDDRNFTKTWTALGSFNVPHPTITDARIISLNSIFLSQKYQALSSAQGCKPVTSTAAADLMAWLDRELATAAQAHQKVWLMFHIPPGIDGYATAMNRKPPMSGAAIESVGACSQSIVPMWKVEWTAEFDALLTKYRNTVVAAFAAHTHSDDFRVVGKEFVLMNPAISPVYSQNPGFRVVTYRPDGTLADHSTYYLTNLPAANSKKKGRWKREYQFTRQWKSKTLDTASLSRLYDEVVASEQVRANWLNLYAVSGPALEGEKPIVRALYCAVEGLSVESYSQCYCGAAKE